MPRTDPTAATRQGDVELLVRMRAGDPLAAVRLLERHRDAVAALGESEGFSSVDASGRVTVSLVRGGIGTDLPFRAAWLAMHARGSLPTADDRTGAVWSAFAALPAAWRMALWHREVEGERLGEIADHLGMDESATSRALAAGYAAMKKRVALAHSPHVSSPECETILGGYRFAPPSVLGTVEVRALREHGRHCDGCLGLIRHLFLIEHALRETLASVVLGPDADRYLATRPRVARLRLAAPGGSSVGRRAVKPAFASLSAAAVGAAAMTLAFAGPQLSSAENRPPSVAGETPAAGSFLSRGPAGSAAQSLPGLLGGSAAPPPMLAPGVAAVAAQAGPDGPAGGDKDSLIPGVEPPVGAEPAEPTVPGTPTSPTPTSPPVPTDPPPPEDEDASVSVSVSSSGAVVEVDVAGEEEPIEVEVPMPGAPVTAPTDLGADDLADRLP